MMIPGTAYGPLSLTTESAAARVVSIAVAIRPVSRPVDLYELGQELLELGVVTVKTGYGCFDVAVRIEPGPGDGVTSVAGELTEESSLRATVTFPEGMRCVDFGQVVGGPLDEA